MWFKNKIPFTGLNNSKNFSMHVQHKICVLILWSFCPTFFSLFHSLPLPHSLQNLLSTYTNTLANPRRNDYLFIQKIFYSLLLAQKNLVDLIHPLYTKWTRNGSTKTVPSFGEFAYEGDPWDIKIWVFQGSLHPKETPKLSPVKTSS